VGIRLYKEPKLENPVLIASWPGIGNIGLIAVDSLRELVEAEEFGEIEPWDFFYPRSISIKKGILQTLEFPRCKFYFRTAIHPPHSPSGGGSVWKRDLIFFVGEEQPAYGGQMYAEGKKAYEMANLVLDVAIRFGCQRIYTSGAAVAPIHHTMRPRVWVVPNREHLIDEVRKYDNAVLMSDIEEREGRGNITGLNGLLLGVAKKRNLEAICVMGEIPIYLQGSPWPYPKASRSVLEVLCKMVGIRVDLSSLDRSVEMVDRSIEELYRQIPSWMREQLDKLKYVTYTMPTESGPITEEDKRRIMEHIDELFRKGDQEGGERPL